MSDKTKIIKNLPFSIGDASTLDQRNSAPLKTDRFTARRRLPRAVYLKHLYLNPPGTRGIFAPKHAAVIPTKPSSKILWDGTKGPTPLMDALGIHLTHPLPKAAQDPISLNRKLIEIAGQSKFRTARAELLERLHDSIAVKLSWAGPAVLDVLKLALKLAPAETYTIELDLNQVANAVHETWMARHGYQMASKPEFFFKWGGLNAQAAWGHLDGVTKKGTQQRIIESAKLSALTAMPDEEFGFRIQALSSVPSQRAEEFVVDMLNPALQANNAFLQFSLLNRGYAMPAGLAIVR